MPKRIAKINKWSITKAPFFGDYVLHGIIEGHQHDQLNGKECYTSPLKRIDLVENTAETENTLYQLGEMEK